MKFLALLSKIFSLAFWFPCAASDEVLSPHLFSLLEITGIEIRDRTLPSIVDATQRAWLRKDGIERWEVINIYTPEKRARIAKECEEMGFFQEIRPKHLHYNYCCIFGASLSTVKARILYAIKLWESGVRFDQIVLLTGARPIDVKVDKVPELAMLPQTEAEAMDMLLSALSLPPEMRQVPVTLIDAPKVGFRRPNTGDTIVEWMKHSPLPGTCLLISNQPWIKYQRAVAAAQMKFPFEVVGASSSSPSKNAAVLLDNVARWLYAENQLLLLQD